MRLSRRTCWHCRNNQHNDCSNKRCPCPHPSCPDCDEAARHAYSDATTPGFFNPKCPKHQADVLRAAIRKACEDAAKYLPEPRGISDADVADIMERHLTPVVEALLQHAPKDTSDGFHTFQELYEHRYALFAVVCKLCDGWKSKQHADETMFEDSFIAGVLTPKGQATYHMPLRLWGEFPAKEIERAPEYDGHTPEDVIQRLALLSVEALRDSMQKVPNSTRENCTN